MEQDSILIRPPRIDDLEQIVQLNRISLPENYPVAYFIELIKSWHETSCVVLHQGQVVGYVITRIERASIAPWRPRSKAKAHVISVAVSHDHRQKGYAMKMMQYVLDQVRVIGNVAKITLEVRESNSAAIHLYEKINYIQEKVLSRYYSDGENAILMVLEL